jgi:hypothetical protein
MSLVSDPQLERGPFTTVPGPADYYQLNLLAQTVTVGYYPIGLWRITTAGVPMAIEGQLCFPSQKYQKTFADTPESDQSATPKNQLR